jgi:hypothetical protein
MASLNLYHDGNPPQTEATTAPTLKQCSDKYNKHLPCVKPCLMHDGHPPQMEATNDHEEDVGDDGADP